MDRTEFAERVGTMAQRWIEGPPTGWSDRAPAEMWRQAFLDACSRLANEKVDGLIPWGEPILSLLMQQARPSSQRLEAAIVYGRERGEAYRAANGLGTMPPSANEVLATAPHPEGFHVMAAAVHAFESAAGRIHYWALADLSGAHVLWAYPDADVRLGGYSVLCSGSDPSLAQSAVDAWEADRERGERPPRPCAEAVWDDFANAWAVPSSPGAPRAILPSSMA
jgi:hypothetical protein